MPGFTRPRPGRAARRKSVLRPVAPTVSVPRRRGHLDGGLPALSTSIFVPRPRGLLDHPRIDEVFPRRFFVPCVVFFPGRFAMPLRPRPAPDALDGVAFQSFGGRPLMRGPQAAHVESGRAIADPPGNTRLAERGFPGLRPSSVLPSVDIRRTVRGETSRPDCLRRNFAPFPREPSSHLPRIPLSCACRSGSVGGLRHFWSRAFGA